MVRGHFTPTSPRALSEPKISALPYSSALLELRILVLPYSSNKSKLGAWEEFLKIFFLLTFRLVRVELDPNHKLNFKKKTFKKLCWNELDGVSIEENIIFNFEKYIYPILGLHKTRTRGFKKVKNGSDPSLFIYGVDKK